MVLNLVRSRLMRQALLQFSSAPGPQSTRTPWAAAGHLRHFDFGNLGVLPTRSKYSIFEVSGSEKSSKEQVLKPNRNLKYWVGTSGLQLEAVRKHVQGTRFEVRSKGAWHIITSGPKAPCSSRAYTLPYHAVPVDAYTYIYIYI